MALRLENTCIETLVYSNTPMQKRKTLTWRSIKVQVAFCNQNLPGIQCFEYYTTYVTCKYKDIYSSFCKPNSGQRRYQRPLELLFQHGQKYGESITATAGTPLLTLEKTRILRDYLRTDISLSRYSFGPTQRVVGIYHCWGMNPVA